MNLFLKRLLVFVLPLFVVMCFLDVFISYNLKKSHNFQGEIEVWNAIYSGNINADIAIYGDSRAWTQINPEILNTTLNQNVYNFGIDGHNFWLQYLRHLLYIEYNQKPKTILLNVDIFTLEKRKELYQLEQFLPYALWNNKIINYTASYEGFTKIDYYVPLLRYSGKTKAIKNAFSNFMRSDTMNFRNKGYKSFDLKWGENEKIMNNIDEYTVTFDQQSILLFENFIKECENLNIKLILIYTPEHIDGQKKIANRSELINLCDKFSKKYKLDFLNYSEDSLQLDKKYFYNSMHLNKKGSHILSHKIANQLTKNLNPATLNTTIN